MLNIYKLLKKERMVHEPIKREGQNVNYKKRFLPANKEWYNALYSFEKNPLRFLPAVHNTVFKLIKLYFNMKHLQIWYRKRSWRAQRYVRAFASKVWVSTPEIKHWADKMTITVFVLDKEYNGLKKKINTLDFSWGPSIRLYSKEKLEKTPRSFLKKMQEGRQKGPFYVGRNPRLYYDNQEFYMRVINWLKNDKLLRMQEFKSNILSLIKKGDKVEVLQGLKDFRIERYNYLIDQFKKELIYIKLKQKMLFHEFKYTEIYLTTLIKMLETVYNKKIEFNFIKLKYFHLSSSILSQILVEKIRNPINRGKPLRAPNIAMGSITVPKLSKNKLPRFDKKFLTLQNVVFANFLTDKKDSLNQFLLTNNTKSKIWSNENVEDLALSNLENKSVSGVFIKLTGRLTKRYKAQRAVYKYRRKGTLQNVHSAQKGFPSSLSKGYSNINVEKTFIHSKVRIGAFGLTGWIASY